MRKTFKFILFYFVMLATVISAVAQDAIPNEIPDTVCVEDFVSNIENKSADTAAKEAGEARITSISAAFLRLPVNYLDILPVSSRLDLLDYATADSIGSVRNALEGKSTLLLLNDDYIKVQLTPVSTLQLRRLPDKKNGYIFVSIYSVGGDGQAFDSDVSFFDETLSPLDAGKIISLPSLLDFFPSLKKNKAGQKRLEQIIPFPTIEFSASKYATTYTLKAYLTIDNFINQDELPFIREHLRSPVTYLWDGVRFKLKKE